MARQIIVTDIKLSPDNSFTVFAVGWLVAPVNRVIPAPNAGSRVPTASTAATWGITTPELAAIQSGTIVEVAFDTGQLQAGTTAAQIKAALVSLYTQAQADLNAKAPGIRFVGAFLDDTTGWTLPS